MKVFLKTLILFHCTLEHKKELSQTLPIGRLPTLGKSLSMALL